MAYHNPTGLPSTTEILQPWINSTYFKEIHQLRGQAVHAAVAAYLQGLWLKPLPPEWQPYMDSAKAWIDQMVDEILLVEERMVDVTLGYTGQPDLICIIKGDDKASLVDWKTSQQPYRWWALQAASYRYLALKSKGIDTYRALGVRLKDDGSEALVNEYRDYFKSLNAFKAALICHKYLS